ncbi:glycosyl transferase [Galbibacter orientalis DSM 19592]|uniref:Glycosyl transferase n=1 Tax=Galbibacter orientalis DSM 19592 TaxID=926559 RepID=I3C6R9_9FLAO|nr:glycosyltransferase [Galbibacter orientalis]EIJ39312.1 glycosyl transferase [Galbibacter orientalis DSM 19592]
MSETFTIIVPVYNEEENLRRVEKELQEYIDCAEIPTSVLFVNDGSKDSSLSIIRQICDQSLVFNYIDFDQNYGLSTAIKAGFDYAESSLIGYIDSDLQTSPMDFNLLLEYIDEYDLVTGVRSNRKDSFTKNLSSIIANGVRRSFTHDGMDDTGCPLKIIKRDCAKRITMFKGLHRFLPAMVLLQEGKVKQVPIQHFHRIAGKGKFGLWNRLLGPLMDCFAFLWMRKKYINYKVEDKG